jgi:dihydroflavonol-4-reductase
MLWKIASGKTTVAIDVGQPTVDIRDVAEAALLAEEHGRTGERYIIANEFIGAREFYALAVGRHGKAMPKLIPYRVAYDIAWVVERLMKLLRRKDYLIRTDAIYLSNVFREMDNGKARRELHWTPRPLSETVRDAIDWFSANDKQQAEAVGRP